MDAIKSDEVDAAIDRLMDEWGCGWRDTPSKRLAIDTLHDCAEAIRVFEDAARQRSLHRAANEIAADVFLPHVRKAGF